MISRKIKQTGFTLIELLLVIAFVTMSGLGIYLVASKISISNSATTETRNIEFFRNSIQTLFSGQTTTTNLSNTIIIDAKIPPLNMTTTNTGDIINSFGGAVLITPQSLNVANDGFRISYLNVPGGICIKLATIAGNAFHRVIIGTTVIKPLGTNTTIDLIAATAACADDAGTGLTMNFDSFK